MKKYNVCIIGSGSAALSLAITLAEKGIKTVLLKQDQRNMTKKYFGETLSQGVTPSLLEMGIENSFLNIFMPRVENSISSWGDNTLVKKTSLFHPSGFGWIFQRDKFENSLLKRLEETAAEIISCNIISVTNQLDHWITEIQTNFDQLSISSAFVIVAIGRDNLNSVQLPNKTSLDKLVSCVVSFKASNNNFDKTIYVDSSKNGWFYSIMNDCGNRTISYFTDGDLLIDKDEKQYAEFLKSEIGNLPSLSKVVKPSDLNKIHFYKVVSANTTFRTSFFTKGILVCGDSAQTYDPLSSQGVANAIKDGIQLGGAIANYYAGNKNSFLEYEKGKRSLFMEYLKNRHNIYSTEVRWKNNPFWERRHNIENLKSFLKKIESIPHLREGVSQTAS